MPLVTTVFAFAMGMVVIAATGHNPFSAFRGIFNGTGLNWFFHVGSHSIGVPFSDARVWFPWNTGSLAAINLEQTLIIVTPLADNLNLDESELQDFCQFRVAEVGPITSTGKALAEGFRQASAPIVAYAEEHSYPEPGWAEALIRAHLDGSWTEDAAGAAEPLNEAAEDDGRGWDRTSDPSRVKRVLSR